MWRAAAESEDEDIVEMSLQLYAEDPAAMPGQEWHTRKTLSVLRAEPTRGCAVALQLNNAIAGYAFLISFWSNELGGEVIVVDELYVRPAHRNQGHGRGLLSDLTRPDSRLWPRQPVALELEVTPQNQRAASLYSDLGFEPIKNVRMRIVLSSVSKSAPGL